MVERCKTGREMQDWWRDATLVMRCKTGEEMQDCGRIVK